MTQTVFNQILSIRAGGTVNMCDWQSVQRVAFDSGFYELVCYISDSPARYFKFILTGELPDGEENPGSMRSASPSTSPSVVEKVDTVEKRNLVEKE